MKDHIRMCLWCRYSLDDIKADVMQTAISTALVACYGNQTAASEPLQINRWTMRKWLNDASKHTYKPFEQVSLCVGTGTAKEMLAEAYREAVSQAMSANNNLTMTAKILKCQRGTVRKYMVKP
jgi:DNA-binding protein Fis